MSDDFGHRLEAAAKLERDIVADKDHEDVEATIAQVVLRIVRAANAQDSAPALAARMLPAPSNEGAGVAGAGVDLAQAMVGLSLVALGENRFIASYEARAILSHIESLVRDAARKESKP